MIAYLASDLLWATRIKAAADALGVPARPVRSLDMLQARLDDTPPPGVRALIVDLAHDDRALAISLIQRIDTENRARAAAQPPHQTPTPPTQPAQSHDSRTTAPIRVVAFAPHVDTDALHAAREAGAHEVYARGAFSDNLPDILLRLHAR